MQHCCRSSRNHWRLAFAVLVAIAGFPSNTRAQTSYQVVAAFDRPYSVGANPHGALIQGSDGSFYGTTVNSGAAGFGTIYKIDPAGTATVLHSFNGSDGANPFGGLIQGIDGSFYGTTNRLGAGGGGTVFKIDVGER